MAKTSLLTVRCPDEIMEAIAAVCGKSGKSRTEIVVDALRQGLGLTAVTTEPAALGVDEKIQAVIAPILTRLEALELKAVHAPVQPTPKNIDTEENAPLLPFLAENLDIAENSPPTMPVNPDENVISTSLSLSKLLSNDVTDDLTKGLNQSELAIRYVVSRQSVGNAIKRGTITQWLKKQGADFDGICWRYDSEKKLFFPEE